MKNLVFIGMVGSKMKKVAEDAANKLNMKFVDTDEVLTRNLVMSLHDIYTLFPLESFNDVTYRLANQLSNGDNYVIAVGDSILMNDDAINVLKENAFTAYIKQDIDSITADCTETAHPLLARGLYRLQELYNERETLFCKYADITVDYSETTVEDVLCSYFNASESANVFDPALHAFFRYFIESKYPSADSASFANECVYAVEQILEKHIPKE